MLEQAALSKKNTKKIGSSEIELEASYRKAFPLAQKLEAAVKEQICSIIEDNDLTLGVPLESRVKSWNSIREKLERVGLQLKSAVEIQDLVGLRAIFLFRNELDAFQDAIRETFDVLSEEDTSERLQDSQFGYQSRHLILKLPASWCDLPSLRGLEALTVEVQIRTVAQHIWAAASHKLQYKREKSVPEPVRRAIFRVSALLETVDLEFMRVLEEREAYAEFSQSESNRDFALNVDSLREILHSKLPAENYREGEPYDRLLLNLNDLGVETGHRVVEIINRHLSKAIESDQKEVEKRRDMKSFDGTNKERIDSGVYWTHVGLMRQVLIEEFGEDLVFDTILKHQED